MMRNRMLFFVFLASALVLLTGEVRAGCLDEGIGFCQANPAACGLSRGCDGLITDTACSNKYKDYITGTACSDKYKDYITKTECNTQISTATSGLIKSTDCPSTTCPSTAGLITQESCDTQISTGAISLDTVNKFRDCTVDDKAHKDCTITLQNADLKLFTEVVLKKNNSSTTTVTVDNVIKYIECAKDSSKEGCLGLLNLADAEKLKTSIGNICKSNPDFCGIIVTKKEVFVSQKQQIVDAIKAFTTATSIATSISADTAIFHACTGTIYLPKVAVIEQDQEKSKQTSSCVDKVADSIVFYRNAYMPYVSGLHGNLFEVLEMDEKLLR